MTFFVSAGVLARHAPRIKRLHKMGHDIGSHGMFHSRMDLLSPEDQLGILEESHRLLTEAGFQASGYRSPYLNYNEDTYEALTRSPYSWSSGEVILWDNGWGQNAGTRRLDSLSNYIPAGQRISRPRLRGRMVEIPVTAPDDEILYERYRVRQKDRIHETWFHVFEKIHSAGEFFHLLFHPERFLYIRESLGDLAKHVSEVRPAVWRCKLSELAHWWEERSTWQWHRAEDGSIIIDGPAQSAVLVKGSGSELLLPESDYFYKKYRLHPSASSYPAFIIGLSPRCPESLARFLHEEGFPTERAASAKGFSIFLDRADFKPSDARALLDEIDGSEKPLLRLWRWPNGYRSAFGISADICAVDLKDFRERTRHFGAPCPYRKIKSNSYTGNSGELEAKSQKLKAKSCIWIDLDNTPHVPFFIPIIRELETRGHRVVLSARDAFQVCELATQSGLTFEQIGHHYGKHMLLKVYGLICRSAQMLPLALREKPDLALSHGARSQVLVANFLGIPSVVIGDYEHSKTLPFCQPKWHVVPEVIPADALGHGKVLTYKGIKEDVYVPFFRPDPGILSELGLSERDLVITVRPPATEAHYHNPEGEVLFRELMDWALSSSEAKIVMLPRNSKQVMQYSREHPVWFSNGRVIVPKHAVDGLNLLWYSDLVVSGGGTMNREAAALGVPVYSIFRGPIGAVDRHLEDEGRLILLTSVEDVRTRIDLRKRQKLASVDTKSRPALNDIIDHIEFLLASNHKTV
ncbi:MAG: DUF354 domain-containing protein [Acidobacteriia bacterium]|nr:DUF354 domain-containing protein [Terriglobia bacterium]